MTFYRLICQKKCSFWEPWSYFLKDILCSVSFRQQALPIWAFWVCSVLWHNRVFSICLLFSMYLVFLSPTLRWRPSRAWQPSARTATTRSNSSTTWTTFDRWRWKSWTRRSRRKSLKEKARSVAATTWRRPRSGPTSRIWFCSTREERSLSKNSFFSSGRFQIWTGSFFMGF